MKVTLVTSFSHHADTLQATIESVLRQTHMDLEYLIVAHSPSAESIALLREYRERFNGAMNYIIANSPDACYAINLGLIKAKGDIIGFLPPNAVYSHPNILEDIVREMETSGSSAVYGDYCLVKGNRLTYKSYNFFGRPMLRLGVMPPLSVFYCKAEVYHECGMFNTAYRSAIGFECLLRLIYIYHIRTLFLPIDIITVYAGKSAVKPQEHVMDRLRALKKYNICSNRFLVWAGRWF